MPYASILAWLTLGPILLQNSLHFSSVQFGWAAMVAGLTYVIGALTPFPKIAGLACSILGTLQILGGFIASNAFSCDNIDLCN
ncbi:MAG: hypothetical protein PVG30_05645 [Gammaproteobacteria bacterium]|jgi:hypothetical protein